MKGMETFSLRLKQKRNIGATYSIFGSSLWHIVYKVLAVVG